MKLWRNIFYSFMIFAGIFTLSVLIHKTQVIGEDVVTQADAELAIARLTGASRLLAVHFQSFIDERKVALYSLAQDFAGAAAPDHARFLQRAKGVQQHLGGIDAIYFVGPDQQTIWISTEAELLFAPPEVFHRGGRMQPWLDEARASGRTSYSDVLPLQLNQSALFLIQPVSDGESFRGWLCGVLPVKAIVESRYDPDRQQPFFLVVQYMKTGEILYGATDNLLLSGDRLGYTNLNFDAADNTNSWSIKLGMNPNQSPPRQSLFTRPSPILLLGLLISAVSGCFTFLILTRNDKLEVEVAERVRDVEASQEELRAIIEGAPMAIVGYDEIGRVFLWNPMCDKVFGYTREEATGAPVESMVATDADAEVLGELKQRVFEGGTLENHVWRTRRKDGSLITCGGSTRHVFHEGSKRKFALLICNDVTKRRQLEAELKRHTEHLEQLVRERSGELADSEARYRQLLSTAKDAIVGINHRQEITLFNYAAERIFGYSAPEVIGQPIWTVLPRNEPANPAGGIVPFLQAGQTERVGMTREIQGCRKNGEIFPMEISLSVFSRDGQPEFTAIIREISERKKMDSKIEEMIRDLRHANQEMEEFTYVVSHDMKAPLRAVKNMSQFLIEDYAARLDAAGLDYLRRLQESTKMMSEMIDNLLELTQISRSKTRLVPVEAEQLIEKVLTILKPPLNAQIHYPKGLPVIFCSPAKMEQVFLNLISNGIKYNRNERIVIEIDCQTRGSDYLFAVRDNGIGIDKAHQYRIFKPFQRLHKKNEYEGTGIGLSIVKKIIQDHGGRIWIESEAGEGATFYFTIPRVQVEVLAESG